jgi:GTP cyclohydrolase II
MSKTGNEPAESATLGMPIPLVEPAASSFLPTRHGDFRVFVYKTLDESVEHVALVKGNVLGKESVLVRVHSECLTGDVFGSQRCDCGEQLDLAMAKIAEAGSGVIVYLRGHEGRGIGLANKIMAYQLQDQGRDTVEANLDLGLPVDTRDYQAASEILGHLGILSIRLMTNNPGKLSKLTKHGINIVERIPVLSKLTPHNTSYLRTKQQKLGHMLDVD